MRLNSNASSNFIGINSITLNDIETTTGGTMTVTNMLPTGKFLTLNSPTFSNTEASTARLFQFNGSGDTILNASVTNGNGGTGAQIIAVARDLAGEQAKGKMRPVGVVGVVEAQRLVGGIGDLHAKFGDLVRLLRNQFQAQRIGIDKDKTVAAIGGVNRQRAQPFNL